MELTNVTYQGGAISDLETFARLPEYLKGVLSSLNGFIQFGGGLHVRGAVKSPKWHSIGEVWGGELALSKLYASVLESDVPFAQDCVGDQFLLRDGEVWRLSGECGDIENLELDLVSFLEAAMAAPIDFLGMQPLIRLQHEGTSLEAGQLIHAYPPFCTNEAANGVSLRAIPALELIGFHADFARQLPPDGEQVRVRIVSETKQ